VTALSAVAETPKRVQDMFLTDSYNNEGIIAAKLFVRGVPTVVTVDDYLPFYGNNLFFQKKSSDGDFWAAFLEKAYAKVNGNYEAIGLGW